MLHYAISFFLIALIAALFAFTGVAASTAGVAKLLFVFFLIVAAAAVVVGELRRG